MSIIDPLNSTSGMNSSLRAVLRESHVAIIAIAVLLAQGVLWLLHLVGFPADEGIGILVDSINYPYARQDFSRVFSPQLFWLAISEAIPCFVVAWILSEWVFGVGPIDALIRHHAAVRR